MRGSSASRINGPAHESSSLVSLARLGVESGGTLTERTDDSRLALDKAVRQLSCSYALGVHGDAYEAGQRHRLSVRVKKEGLRAVHATAYLPRSAAVKRESLIRAAYLSPESFATGEVRAALQRVEPLSKDTWKAELGLGFEMPWTEAEFGAVVTRGSSVVHRVARSISSGTGASIVFLEPVSLRSGSYAVTAVLFDPAASLPRSVNVLVELPPVPAQGPFLVGPVLGRRGPGRHVVRAGLDASGDRPGEFEPLLVPRMTRPEDLVAVTRVCSFDHAEAAPPRRVVRTLRSAAGVVLQGLHPVAVMLAKQQAAWCGDVTDVIPATALRHGEAYVFEARFSDDPARPPGTARFSVGPAPR